MNKRLIELTIITGASVLALAGIVSLASCMLKAPDNPIEEAAETAIESILEDHFNLPSDTLDIDLTPGSKEDD